MTDKELLEFYKENEDNLIEFYSYEQRISLEDLFRLFKLLDKTSSDPAGNKF